MNEAAIRFLTLHGMNPDTLDTEAALATFMEHMDAGLSRKDSSLQMIPTYISVGKPIPQDIPVAVLDAGGTNLRVGITEFTAQGPVVSDSSVGPMPGTLKPLEKQEFLDALADLLAPALQRSTRMGFCFSFPAEITADLDGICQGFNKEIHVADDKGMAVCAELCRTLEARGIPAPSYALINDTVAALLGGYGTAAPQVYDGFIGFILGTGVNCCYTEQNRDILKLPGLDPAGNMIINVESGNFSGFPMGDFDREMDAESTLPGDHLYEKMVSGAYFGQLCYTALRGACREGLFSQQFCSVFPETITTRDIGEFLAVPAASGCLADLCADENDRAVLYTLLERLMDRAARMVAINLTAVLIRGEMGSSPLHPACIVAEGSTFQKSEVYQERIRHYMNEFARQAHGRYYRFISVDQANMQGAAVAALLKA